MRRILLSIIISLMSVISWAQPANDNCNTAQNLGTLPNPAACPSGVGTSVNVTGTNLLATYPLPYTTLLGCQTGGNQPGPAMDVWYRFVASGNQVNINITPGAAPVLPSPAITLWTGSCGSLVGVGCDNNGTAGGNNSATFQPLTPGQTYYIQVSGMTTTAAGNFNLSVNASNDCNNCLQVGNLTVSPAPVGGTYLPGTTVNFCYNITSYTQVSSNWLHGLTFNFGAGWNPATLTTTPPASCSGSGYWAWYNSWTSSATGTTWGPGFAYDYNTSPGNPGNNFGDNCSSPNWNFCWSIQTDPTCTGSNTNLNITINTSGDGESGSWTSLACTGDPNVNFSAVLACCSATAVGTNPTCFGGTNGSAVVTPTGTGPFTYSWNTTPVQTTQTATGLGAGTYTVTVTATGGCVSTATVTLTNPPVMTAAITPTSVTCNGGNNGSAIVNPTGSVGPYTYLWSNGQTTQTATGLVAGTYSVTVTSSVGCTVTNSVTITQPAAITISMTSAPATCSLSNGQATATPSGGTGPYTYSWNTTPVQTTQTATGLGVGTYTVTVTGIGGCTATATATITSSGAITSSITGTNVSCFGGSNGSATVVGSGGSGIYTYLWSNGQTSATATGLSAGTYSVTVTNLGCTSTSTINITQPTLLTATNSQSNVTCFGGNNGSATVTPSGGTGPYTYSWNTTPVQITPTVIGLVAGTYTCLITDANGCTNSQVVVITQPTPITSTVTSTVSTCGLANGSATVNPSGGVGPYIYSWSTSPTQTTQTATGLLPGTYTVTITGVGGCTSTNSVIITSPGAPTLSISSSTNVSCNGGSNGTANTSVVSGSGPFTYLWSNGQTTSNVTGLVAGTYTVTLTDANSCQSVASVTITQPSALTSAITTTNVSCNGGNNGQANVTSTGGVGPYNYSWNTSPIQTTSTASGLTAGTYTVTVTDSNGCSNLALANITQPSVLSVSVLSSVNPLCFGSTNGSINVSATGGTGTYQYSLNGGPNQLSSIFSGLTAGSYTITVTDANSCQSTTNINLTQPTSITSTITTTNVTCNGSCNGQVLLSVIGGVGPYNYLWSNGSTSNPATGLCAGTYSVVITDVNGCQLNLNSISITQPPTLSVTTSATPSTICIGQATNISGIPTGGTAPYSYIWTSGSTTQITSVSPTVTTTYSVQVTDINGCIVNGNVTVNVNPPITLNLTASSPTICSGDTSTLTANAFGGDGLPYTYIWTPGGPGQTISVSPITTTTYTVTVSDGCSPNVTSTITIVVNPNPVVSFTTTNLSGCEPLTVTYTNTTPGSTNCVWNINSVSYNNCVVTQTFTNPGTYNSSLTITDANGCISNSTVVTANVYPVPVANFTVNPPIVNIGDPTIYINNTSSAGSYSWNFGDGNISTLVSPSHSYSDTGNYNVQLVVVTQYGCSDTANVTIYIGDVFSIYVPNAFTPNGDKTNEVFTPVVMGYEYYEFWIFDRWGEMIYYSTKSGTPWDGTYKGREVKQDVYVWKVHAKEKDNAKHHNLVGKVVLLR